MGVTSGVYRRICADAGMLGGFAPGQEADGVKKKKRKKKRGVEDDGKVWSGAIVMVLMAPMRVPSSFVPHIVIFDRGHPGRLLHQRSVSDMWDG
jgi:hypothetical protein